MNQHTPRFLNHFKKKKKKAWRHGVIGGSEPKDLVGQTSEKSPPLPWLASISDEKWWISCTARLWGGRTLSFLALGLTSSVWLGRTFDKYVVNTDRFLSKGPTPLPKDFPGFPFDIPEFVWTCRWTQEGRERDGQTLHLFFSFLGTTIYTF